MRSNLILVAAALLSVGAPASAAAQTYAAADVQYGARLYGEQCTVCHGATGDVVAGVDLRANRFKQSSSDNDLRNVITNGVTGTGMPPFKFEPPEITAIVAYLRNMRDFDAKTSLIGDPAQGRMVFEEKGQCGQCHRVFGKGPRVAPDLSDIGALRTPDALLRAIVDPEAEMRYANRGVRAVTRDGTVISGRRMNEDTFTVQLIDEKERLVSLVKADLREYGLVTRTSMPSYRGKLSETELADLLAYLLSLKGL